MATTASHKDQRPYVTGSFHLELDGEDVGILTSVDGGNLKSEAIGEQVGGENLVTRYPGRQKFEDITLQIGSSMSKKFWKWLKDSLDNKPSRRNGAIVARDFDHRERARRTFMDALISEVQFPELDAKSKQAKIVTIKIAPEQLKHDPGKKEKPATGPGSFVEQKKALPMNFSFQLDGFPAENTRRVSKIESFSVKQQIIDSPAGGLLYTRREPGRIEFPTLAFHLPETDAGPWIKWWEEFVGRGNHVQKNEHTGSITYLSSNLKERLMTLHLFGVGITGITFAKHEAGGDSIRTVKVELYVERIALDAA